MKYVVAATYLGDSVDGKLLFRTYEARDPFHALLQDCMTARRESRWQVCTWLEDYTPNGTDPGWDAAIAVLEPEFSPLAWDDFNLPWEQIRLLQHKIERLSDTISHLEMLVRSNEEFSLGLTETRAAYDRARNQLVGLNHALDIQVSAWEDMKAEPCTTEREIDVTEHPHVPAKNQKSLGTDDILF